LTIIKQNNSLVGNILRQAITLGQLLFLGISQGRLEDNPDPVPEIIQGPLQNKFKSFNTQILRFSIFYATVCADLSIIYSMTCLHSRASAEKITGGKETENTSPKVAPLRLPLLYQYRV